MCPTLESKGVEKLWDLFFLSPILRMTSESRVGNDEQMNPLQLRDKTSDVIDDDVAGTRYHCLPSIKDNKRFTVIQYILESSRE